MNVRLLRKVAKHIAKEPRRLNMNAIAHETTSKDPIYPPCGTVGCIAGWSCILSGVPAGGANLKKAAELLDLSREQSYRLFAEPHFATEKDFGTDYRQNLWPIKFAKRHENAKTPRGRAAAVLARIEHFIKTKGAE